ncbi:hypothetical protein PV328_005410, partial [Microctonus aethiopoides]
IQSVSDISGKKYNDDDTNSSDDEDKNKCVIGTFETKKLSAQVIKRRQSRALIIMGSDVMGFPTDVREENLAVLATQSRESILQKFGKVRKVLLPPSREPINK